ncbi:MAG: TetR/AcrR family transcriptional regulator [Methanomicrobium sp.]|nr:TetR/AcrR family transcriptional regulator [Methanomicrobium sp.]
MTKKDLRRQQIIQAAAEVFGNSNFQSAVVSEIAQKANVAEGTIYQYFKNKEDLFFSIPAQKTEEFCEEFNLHLQGIHDALNKIRKLIWYYLYFFKTNPAYARILMLEMRVSKSFIKSETYGRIKAFTNKILEIIKDGQQEGSIRKDVDIYTIRELMLGIMEYRVTRWLLKGEKYDLVENYNEICDLILNGIKSSG